MITFKQYGDFHKTEQFFKNNLNSNKLQSILVKYAKEGVNALANSTPIDTGKTASSWSYTIKKTSYGLSIVWTNSNIVDGVPIAIILQYGHGTRNGGYVQGVDYINPALKPVFEKILNEIWKEVRK